MLATRNLDTVFPLAIDGLTAKTNGLKDAYVTEGGQMVQYTVTDPKQIGTLVNGRRPRQPRGSARDLQDGRAGVGAGHGRATTTTT